VSRAVALVELLARSPYATLALRDDVHIDVIADDWCARIRSPGGRPGVLLEPALGNTGDGTLTCSAADLDRMLDRKAPVDGVRLLPGTRDIAPRKRQAHLVLIAAALGWAGPWPDPLAPAEHHGIVVNALCDLAIGPNDRSFRAGGLTVRGTDTAAGCSLLADAGSHAVRLDVPAREELDPALQILARIALHVQRHGAPRGDAWFGDQRVRFEPDPAFPCGWTVPGGRGGVWVVRNALPFSLREKVAP
jgi:hypothetical protein